MVIVIKGTLHETQNASEQAAEQLKTWMRAIFQQITTTSVAGRDDATVVNTILPKLFSHMC